MSHTTAFFSSLYNPSTEKSVMRIGSSSQILEEVKGTKLQSNEKRTCQFHTPVYGVPSYAVQLQAENFIVMSPVTQ